MAETPRPQTGAWRTYLQLATGLGETSRKQVRKVVKDLLGKGNATADQVRAMSGELLAVNTVNREALAKLVKIEVDRALGRIGLATMDEVTELTARVRDLERQLKEARAVASSTVVSARVGEPAARRGRPASKAGAAPAPASPVVKKATRKAAAAKATIAKATGTAATKATTAQRTAAPAKAAPAKGTAAKATKTTAARRGAAKATRATVAKAAEVTSARVNQARAAATTVTRRRAK
jgi:polyhydroxyalkanoate synthesis regulator phasin